MLHTVPMEVAKHHDLAVSLEPLNESLSVPYGRVLLGRRSCPLAVEVAACHVCPVLSVYHAIWIQHGNDLEDKDSAQTLSLAGGPSKKVNQTPHHPGGVALARMYTRRQEYHLARIVAGSASLTSLGGGSGAATFIRSDGEHLALRSCRCRAQGCHRAVRSRDRRIADFLLQKMT